MLLQNDFLKAYLFKGQVIPQGLHIRINLSTGLKEAKLLVENKSNALSITKNENIENESKFNNQELKEALQNIKNENPSHDDKLKQKFRTMEELKDLMKNNNVQVKTESEIIIKLLQEYKDLEVITDVNIDKALSILQDLEYLVHKFDNGLEFLKHGGIELIVIPNLDNITDEITMQTLELVAACMQNNKKVQQLIFEYGIGEKILKLVEHGSNGIKNKALYTLGCLVRDFPHAQQKLVIEVGSSILRKVLNDFDEHDMKVKLRLITLLQDLSDENASSVNLADLLKTVDYCRNIEQLIVNSKNYFLGNHDNIEKLLKALDGSRNFCQNKMPLTNSFKSSLHDLSIFYSNLADEEKTDSDHNEGYFTEISNLIDSLANNFKISEKQEL